MKTEITEREYRKLRASDDAWPALGVVDGEEKIGAFHKIDGFIYEDVEDRRFFSADPSSMVSQNIRWHRMDLIYR